MITWSTHLRRHMGVWDMMKLEVQYSETFNGYMLLYPDDDGRYSQVSFWHGSGGRPFVFKADIDAEGFLAEMEKGRAGAIDECKVDPLPSPLRKRMRKNTEAELFRLDDEQTITPADGFTIYPLTVPSGAFS